MTALAHGNTVAWGHVRSLTAGDELYTCFIVAGEREYGIRNAPGRQRQTLIRSAGAPIFAALRAVWDSSPAITLEYGHITAHLRVTGQLIPTNDTWIAATARVYGATVVTTDPHFRRVPGLNVVDWTLP